MEIVECFVKTFGKERIYAVIADREFIGKQWLDYLSSQGIPFVFRLKEEGQFISNSRGEMRKISVLLHWLRAGESVALHQRKVGKTDTTLQYCTATRSLSGELLVIIHSQKLANPLEIYKERWNIETMFKAFKTSGFNLEATHLTDYDRLHTLLCVMAITFCIAYKTGEISTEMKPEKPKSNGFPPHSICRTGLDTITNAITNITMKINEIKEIFGKITAAFGKSQNYQKFFVR